MKNDTGLTGILLFFGFMAFTIVVAMLIGMRMDYSHKLKMEIIKSANIACMEQQLINRKETENEISK